MKKFRHLLPVFPKLESTAKRRKATKQRPQPFRHLRDGSGGTYDFTDTTLQHIGTDCCRSCVGVYFAVDEHRCFAAHIWTWIKAEEGRTGGLQIADEQTYGKLRQEVARRLDEESVRAQWGPVTEEMRRSLVIVCRQLAPDGDVQRDTVVGNCVVAAVKEWLGIPKARRIRARPYGGFVVKRPEANVEYCQLISDAGRWRAVDEPPNVRWYFGI